MIEHTDDIEAWCGEHDSERVVCGCPYQDPAVFLRRQFTDGATFILDTPGDVTPVWGAGSDVLWSTGESCIIAGPPGVGKTTLTGQLVRALLGLSDDVLGYPVAPATGRVLYLAMDRPRQIARALRRHFRASERAALTERLTIWPGPPPADLARNPGMLLTLAQQAGASHVVLDSLKDAALGLTEDEAGAGYNRARQLTLAAGIEVLELHHVVKRGPNGTRPNTLADLYGSVWLTAGAGSVLLLWGAAGDLIVELTHLKQPAEPVGPLRITHDHEAGTSTVWQAADPLMLLRASRDGITAADLAAAMYEAEKPTRTEVERARRKLERLVEDGLAVRVEGGQPRSGGGTTPTRYKGVTDPAERLTERLTHPISPVSLTQATEGHDPSVAAGQRVTQRVTRVTQPSVTHAHIPLRDVRACAACGEPLLDVDDGATTHPACSEESSAA